MRRGSAELGGREGEAQRRGTRKILADGLGDAKGEPFGLDRFVSVLRVLGCEVGPGDRDLAGREHHSGWIESHRCFGYRVSRLVRAIEI
jgi:hypothetical protein